MAEADTGTAQGDLLKDGADKGAAAAAADGATTDVKTDAQADAGKAAAAADAAKAADADKGKDADKAKADGDKAKADAAPVVDYAKTIAEVKLPEGIVLDEATAKAGGEVFAKYKLPAEAVKELTELYAKQIKAGQDGSAKAFSDLVGKWKAASESDKDIGGKPGMAEAKTAVQKFFDPDTVKILEHFGLMDHPGFIKSALKINKAIKDDTFVSGDAATVNGSGDARKLFPKSNMNP